MSCMPSVWFSMERERRMGGGEKWEWFGIAHTSNQLAIVKISQASSCIFTKLLTGCCVYRLSLFIAVYFIYWLSIRSCIMYIYLGIFIISLAFHLNMLLLYEHAKIVAHHINTQSWPESLFRSLALSLFHLPIYVIHWTVYGVHCSDDDMVCCCHSWQPNFNFMQPNHSQRIKTATWTKFVPLFRGSSLSCYFHLVFFFVVPRRGKNRAGLLRQRFGKWLGYLIGFG